LAYITLSNFCVKGLESSEVVYDISVVLFILRYYCITWLELSRKTKITLSVRIGPGISSEDIIKNSDAGNLVYQHVKSD
jgi:hypothetical protein